MTKINDFVVRFANVNIHKEVTFSMFLRAGAFLVVLLLVPGCINIAGGEWQGHEASRVKSGDGTSDAVIVEGSAGATTGVTTMVFVVPSDTKYDSNSGVFDMDNAQFRADKVQDLTLSWTRPDFLEIRFQKARVFAFSNFTYLGNDYHHCVELRLVPLDQDSSLFPSEGDSRSRK